MRKNLKVAIDNDVRFVTGTTNIDPKVLEACLRRRIPRVLGDCGQPISQ